MGKIKILLKRILPSIVKDMFALRSILYKTKIGDHVKLNRPYRVFNSEIGSYSYLSRNAQMAHVEIGRFCSVGPNFLAGWGLHPTDLISTAPMFYSTKKQNGMTLVDSDKVIERKPIIIGNDVFIGANVTILDGVHVGDGAVIAAGAIVNSDVAPYSIVGGVPAKEIKKRFPDNVIQRLQEVQWWNFSKDKLKLIAQYSGDVDRFLNIIGGLVNE